MKANVSQAGITTITKRMHEKMQKKTLREDLFRGPDIFI